MKFLVIATIVIVCSASIYAGGLSEESKEKIAATKKACMDAVPDISPDNLAKLFKHELVDDKHVKDFVFCFHKQMNMQNADGSFNVDVIKEKFKMLTGDDHAADVDGCLKGANTKDAVQDSWAFAQCISPKWPKVEA